MRAMTVTSLLTEMLMGSALIATSLYVVLSVVREVLTDLWIAEQEEENA